MPEWSAYPAGDAAVVVAWGTRPVPRSRAPRPGRRPLRHRFPGSSTRGARRIVAGQEVDEDDRTADHCATFDLLDHGC